MKAPLRALASRAAPEAGPPAEARDDRDLLPIAVILWVASVARVFGAFTRAEVFGAEATLALACIVLIPWLAWISRNPGEDGRPRGGRGDRRQAVARSATASSIAW